MNRVDRKSLEIELYVRLGREMANNRARLRSRLTAMHDGAIEAVAMGMLSEVDSSMARVMRIGADGTVRQVSRGELNDALSAKLTGAVREHRTMMGEAAKGAIVACMIEALDNESTYVERRDGNAMYMGGRTFERET